MTEQSKHHWMRQRLRQMSHEILWALLITLIAIGAIAASLTYN